ncbi:MAG TPA: DUF998 domain-containing protein [Nitriliruptorales bacterium]|nr:DUF998 domain-containing protein [Nitriliruptorales bacterium]
MSGHGAIDVGRPAGRADRHPPGPAGRRRRAGAAVARLGDVAIAATASFVVLIGVLHLLRPDVDPIQRPTSEYAVGPFGWLMTAAFLSLSAATWALVIGLHRDLTGAARSRLGVAALGAFGIGLVVAAAFPIDLDGAPPTVAGTVHAINGPLTFLSLIVGVSLVSRRLQHDARWRPVHRIAWPLALLLMVEFVGGGLAAATTTGAGIAQRLLLVTFATWFVLVGARLRSDATGRAT